MRQKTDSERALPLLGVDEPPLFVDLAGSEPEQHRELAAVGNLGALPVDHRDHVAGLADLGITAGRIVDGDLNADEDGEVLAATLECVDDLAAVEGFVDSFIAGAAAEGTTLSRDEARCTIRALQADDQNAAIRDCLGERVDQGTFGDDPILDLLVEQCRRGNDLACDELFATSPIGSAYETFGRTCGGRHPDGADPTCFDAG